MAEPNKPPSKMDDCKHFVFCSAPLCPLHSGINSGGWFTDEEVCRNKHFRDDPMVVRQKWLAKHRPRMYEGKLLKADWLRETVRKKRELTEQEKQELLSRLKGRSAPSVEPHRQD